jgi:hypothetical protein
MVSDVGSPFAETIKFGFRGCLGWPASSFYRTRRIRQVGRSRSIPDGGPFWTRPVSHLSVTGLSQSTA